VGGVLGTVGDTVSVVGKGLGDTASGVTQGLSSTTKDAGKVVTGQTDNMGGEAKKAGEQWKQL
jgi:hypothetical protein